MSTLLHAIFAILLFPGSNGLQVFHTNTMDEYRNDIISCDNSEDCIIICDYINGCRNTQINCPIDHSCEITCSATKSCDNTIVMATHSSSLTIHGCSIRSGSFTCNGLSIYLPPNNNGISRAIIDGGDDDLSQGVGNNVTFDAEESIEESPMNFYAIYGWNDIEIVNYSDPFKYQTGIMHCTVGYDVSCPFSDNAWSCQDIHHICNNPQVIYPTATTSSSPEFVSYIVDKSESINKLWYVVHGLIICIVLVICIFTICVVRSYRIEKELMDKCEAANDELIRLCKMYMYNDYSGLSDLSPIPNNISNTNPSSVEPQTHKLFSDEKVAVEIISTPESIQSETMMSINIDNIDAYDDDDIKSDSVGHSPIKPNEEGDTRSSQLKLSHIPIRTSMILKTNYSQSSTITNTQTSIPLKSMLLNRKDSQISANSSMFSVFHELNNDDKEVDTQASPTLMSISSLSAIITPPNQEFVLTDGTYYPNGNHIFNRENMLTILNDETEDEFVD